MVIGRFRDLGITVTTENANVIVTLPAVWDFIFWLTKMRLHVECFLKMA